MTQLLPPGLTFITEICGRRDASIEAVGEAAEMIEEGLALASEARKGAEVAADGACFALVDREAGRDYASLFTKFDRAAACEAYRHAVDARIWMRLFRDAGIERLMDAKARSDFFAELTTNPPPVTEENVHDVFANLATEARLIFRRGLARCFSALDSRFRSHDAFKLGSRIILTRLFDDHGHWNFYSEVRGALADMERTLAVLDGKEPNPGALVAAVDASREGWGPRQGVAHTEYLRIRTFKNGNAHLWFERPDLVEAANLELAAYYGEVLPDALRPGEVAGSTALARDLAFYPTPRAAAEQLVYGFNCSGPGPGRTVLEPSAGTGNLVEVLLEAGWPVDAVEVDPARARETEERTGLQVLVANFLDLQPQPRYHAVAMNPPFSGTHWIEHVIRAHAWLRPRGTLRAILPATAEIGTSRRHVEFRQWLDSAGSWRFETMPAESFAASGTRVSTVILHLLVP